MRSEIPTIIDTNSRILIIGSFAPSQIPCGITESVKNFSKSPITKYYDLEIISNYRKEDPLRKLIQRIGYGLKLAVNTARHAKISNANILDVHAVSGRDFLKNSAVVIAGRVSRRPVVLRIHGGNFDSVYNTASSQVKMIIRNLLRIPDRVVVLSKSWANLIESIQPKAKIVVIPNSINCRLLAEISTRRVRHTFDVILLGNLCKRKGHFDALEAAKIVVNQFPKCRFLFAGAERDKGILLKLRDHAKKLNIEKNIVFLGPVFGEEKINALTKAGIFILPSHVENMPLSLMEAMASGLPVIASRVGAIPEMVNEGKTGILMDPHDIEGLAAGILVLLNDNELRISMGKAGQKAAMRKWDLHTIAAITDAMYQKLL